MDDDPFVLAFLAELLDECGIDTVRADGGRTGLQLLSEELASVDLLVTDLVMPDLAGDALVLAVRELGASRDLPIVVASSFLDEARAEALRQAGADAVVDKARGLGPVAAAARTLLAARGQLGLHAVEPQAAQGEHGSVPLFRIELAKMRH